MELLIIFLIEALKEVTKHIVREFWTLVKKCIKKTTFTRQRRKGGKSD